MKSFIQRLYQDRDKVLNILLLDDTRPGQDNSYTIKPKSLFLALGFVSVLLAGFVALIFMLTPLGSLLYSTDEMKIRNEIKGISDRIVALQDSLEVRDQQLQDIKTVIRLNQDTTLSIDERLRQAALDQAAKTTNSSAASVYDINLYDNFGDGYFLTANILSEVPDFPAQPPVEGTISRGYEPMKGHYGIDIASTENEQIKSVADGSVISSGWTIDFGYVISIQHNDGLVSTYKHCSKLYKTKGEKVLKGDILGLIGDTGISSTGPHVHFEIWKNGSSQNPNLYLIF
jgi:murein DD-endopeptidase MepM/ murein hydrolase activator NlpD